MIDRALMDDALRSTRQARAEAESAILDVESMIDELQRWQPGRQRVVFSISGWEDELSPAAGT